MEAPCRGYLAPSSPSPLAASLARRFGGYQGVTLSTQFLGIGLVVVLLAGVVIWHRDRRLWLFGAVGIMSMVMSFGVQFGYWTPWRLVVSYPLLENVLPSRFQLMTYLCAGVMLGLIVDHTYWAVNRWHKSEDGPPAKGLHLVPHLGVWAALVVAAVALVPVVAYLQPEIPMTTQRVRLPTWFEQVAPRLTGHQVVLTFPPPFGYYATSLTWQAVSGMHYSIVGGDGPGGAPAREGSNRRAEYILNGYTLSGAPKPPTQEQIIAVRQALTSWGVTMVVLPNENGLPAYGRVRSTRSIAVLMSAVVGEAPLHQSGALVWTLGNRSSSNARTGQSKQRLG